MKEFIKRQPALFGFILRVKHFPEEFRSWFYFIVPASPLEHPETRALHGDHMWQKLAVQLLRTMPISSIVETGTYKGFTTSFLASHFTGPISTVELIGMYYRESRSRLARYPYVRVIRSSSDRAIRQLISSGRLGNLPLFFLDAHWYDYWPLADELRVIGTLPRAIIMIDDMQVPGRDDFGYDIQQTELGPIPSDMKYIERALPVGQPCRVFVPAYHYRDAQGVEPKHPGDKMRGYMVLFWGLEAEAATFAATEFVRGAYKEYELHSAETR